MVSHTTLDFTGPTADTVDKIYKSGKNMNRYEYIFSIRVARLGLNEWLGQIDYFTSLQKNNCILIKAGVAESHTRRYYRHFR